MGPYNNSPFRPTSQYTVPQPVVLETVNPDAPVAPYDPMLAQAVAIPQQRISQKSKFWIILSILLTASLLGMIGLVVAISKKQAETLNSSVATQYENTSVNLGNVSDLTKVSLGQLAQLSINGTLKINGALVLASGEAPTNPETGQVYFDKKDSNVYFYDGAQFKAVATTDSTVASIGGITGNVQLGQGLIVSDGQLSLTSQGGITSVQGKTGALQLGRGLTVATDNTIASSISLVSSSANILLNESEPGKYDISLVGIAGGGTKGQVLTKISNATFDYGWNTLNLQTAYDINTSGIAPEIKVDSTRGGVDIQDANTSTGTSLLTVRASNSSGLGAAMFDIGSTGQTVFKNSVDSTAALEVKNASGADTIFNIDTLNKTINLNVDGITGDIKTWGGAGYQQGNTIITTADGGYAVVGINNNLTQNSSFIVKYDSNSNILWSKSIDIDGSTTQVSGVTQTTDGGYVLSGYSQDTTTNEQVMFVTKLSSTGNYLWTKTWSGSSQNIGYKVVANPDGGITVVGISIEVNSGNWETAVARYDSIGNLVWNKTFNINNLTTYPYAIVRLADGGYVITGSADNGTDSDMFIAKLSSSGNSVWTKTWSGTGYEDGEGLVATSDGGIAVTGYTDSFGNANGAAYIAKFDTLGNLAWNKVFATTNYASGYAITQTTDGGYAITGAINDSVTNLDRAFVAKVTNSGNLVWAQTFGGDTYEYGQSIAPSPNGGVAVTGISGSFGIDIYDTDSFIAKYSAAGSVLNCLSPICDSTVLTMSSPLATIINPSTVFAVPVPTESSPSTTVANSTGTPGFASKGYGLNVNGTSKFTGASQFLGKVRIKPSTNSVDALKVQNAVGGTVFTVDTLNGRVGIGTAVPTAALDVTGDAVVNGNARINGNAVFQNPTDSGNAFSILNSSGANILNVDTENKRIGINTATANNSLDVVGSVVFKSSVNRSNAFQTQDSSGNNLLSVDSYNKSVSIGNFVDYSSSEMFNPAVNYTDNYIVNAVEIADLDNDGFNDITVTNSGNSRISVRKNSGSGTFASRSVYGADGNPKGLASGDLDNDGDLDMVTGNGFTNNASVLLNNGDGTYAAATTYSVGQGARGVTLGDFNGDGYLDIAVANDSDSVLSVLINNGNGTFIPAVNYTAGSSIWAVVSADFNGDGKIDLAASSTNTGEVRLLMNNGDGTFAASVGYSVGSGPLWLEHSDINSDGYEDIVVANSGSNTFSVLLNNGNGTFKTSSSFSTGSNPYGITVGDFDGDGIKDVAVSNNIDNSVSVIKGAGDGTFINRADFKVGYHPWHIASGDLNGDGKSDIVTANRDGDSFSVLMNSGKGFEKPPTLNVVSATPDHDSIRIANASNYELLKVDGYGNTVIGDSKMTFNYGAKTDYATGVSSLYSKTIVGGDFNNDGNNDIASTNESDGTISILFGNGDGTLNPRVDYVSGTNVVSLATGDFNNDGYLDIVTANNGLNTLSIFINNGDGTFAAKVDYSTPSASSNTPSAITTGDFNHDGSVDIALMSINYDFSPTALMSIYLNNGDGTFAASTDYAARSYTSTLVATDVNNDGYLDIVSPTWGTPTLSVFINNGNGTFAPKADYGYGPGYEAKSIVAADFDGDGDTDIALGNTGYNTVTILKNNGSGVFSSPTSFTGGSNLGRHDISANTMGFADVDLDGDLDLIISNYENNTVDLLTNDGTGNFEVKKSIAIGSYPRSAYAIDLNNDGSAEIITGNSNNTLSVIMSDSGPASADRLKIYDSRGATQILTISKTGATSFKSSSNGSSAFQVQDSSGSSIFTVNTATAGASVAGTFSVTGSTTSLNITGVSMVTIGSTAGASATTIQAGTGNLNLVTNSATASVIVKSTTNGATAFQVQNATGVSLLTVDSQNDLLYVGSPVTDTVGTLLVLDTKNTAGDPTGVEGAMYFNSNAGRFRCYANGAWRDCTSPLVAANTSVPVANTVTNTAVETDFASNYTIPANSCQPGKAYRVTARGVYSTAAAPGNIALKVKLGTTIVGSTVAASPTANLTDRGWATTFTITCASSGVSGSVEGQGATELFTSATSAEDRDMVSTSTVTVDTTVAQVLQLSAQWATADPANSMSLRQLLIEEL